MSNAINSLNGWETDPALLRRRFAELADHKSQSVVEMTE